MLDAYHIERNSDGTCNVTFYDNIQVYDCEHGKEYDFDEYTLRGLPYHEWLDDNIRMHFKAWKAHAMAFEAERAAMLKVIDDVVRGRGKDVVDVNDYQNQADASGESGAF